MVRKVVGEIDLGTVKIDSLSAGRDVTTWQINEQTCKRTTAYKLTSFS